MVTAEVNDFPCFTAFLFFGPYSNLKFIIFIYTCVYFFFVYNIIVLMNLWIPCIKRKKAPGIQTI